MSSQQSVLGILLVIGAVIAWRNVKETGHPVAPGDQGFRQLVALLILGAILALLSQWAPGVAGPLAVLIGIAVAIAYVPGLKGKAS